MSRDLCICCEALLRSAECSGRLHLLPNSRDPTVSFIHIHFHVLFLTISAPKTTTMRPTEFQGVILCGPGNDLYPLTQHSGSVSKALLPVCNQPLLDNPLRLAEQLGLAECLVLCQTQKEADDISSWTRRRQSSVKVEVWATADSSQSAPLHPKPVSARNGADHPDHGPDQDLQSEPNDQEEGSGDSEEDEDEDKEEEEEEEAQGHSSTAAEGTIAALRWAATQGLLKSDFVLFSCDVHMDPEHAEEALRSVLDRHRRDDCLLSTLLVQAPEDSKPKGPS